MPVAPITAEGLRLAGLSSEVVFATTDDLEELDAPFGQQRAAEALQLSIALQSDSHHAYVMGPPGVGKHALVSQMLERAAIERPTPSDWCYLNDFADPRRPRAVELPPGSARAFQRDVEGLVAELRAVIPAAFESPEYRSRVQALEKELEAEQERAIEVVRHQGVLILAGYLGERYCADRPLTLAATVVLEQSYAPVDGDSASSAELYALLSAIGELPITQALAVTGSVDQLGRVQAVGAVTEKVEGFFDVCQARGLTGRQGVLVPASNVPHLVLRDDVLAAIAEERFRIFPVSTIDEGIELLTGLPAGSPDASGGFPPSSVGARVSARLAALADRAREFAGVPGSRDRR